MCISKLRLWASYMVVSAASEQAYHREWVLQDAVGSVISEEQFRDVAILAYFDGIVVNVKVRQVKVSANVA